MSQWNWETHPNTVAMHEEMVRLREELATCQKDAERYRVIREQNIKNVNAKREHWEPECTVELFDKALDAAIEATTKGGG